MFTGIVEEIGAIKNIVSKKEVSIFTISCVKSLEGLKTGDSIAVEGVCLTVVNLTKKSFTVDVVTETMDRSTMSFLKEEMEVNLELPLKFDGRLGGHFVQGHVDCMGTVNYVKDQTEDYRVSISIPSDKSLFTIEKGSITINGVSLTITDKDEGSFGVALIPHTLQTTTLNKLKKEDRVNLEFDILGKYVKNILQYS